MAERLPSEDSSDRVLLGLGYPQLVALSRQDINNVLHLVEPIDVLYIFMIGAAGLLP